MRKVSWSYALLLAIPAALAQPAPEPSDPADPAFAAEEPAAESGSAWPAPEDPPAESTEPADAVFVAEEPAADSEPVSAAEETSAEPSGHAEPAFVAAEPAPESSLPSPHPEEPPVETLPTIPVAQTEPIAPPPLPEENAPAQLDEVVVTATKRAAPVRNIPATIAVLNGEDLEREGVESIDQIVTRVPGVNLTDDGLGQAKRVTIRGIAADVNANFTAGTLFGDIPFSDPFVPKVQLDPNPFDMATVEVLKGPQGTLFGGSGLNGMIRYVPEQPDFSAVTVKYFGQFTSYPGNGGSGWSYGAVVNAPFADNRAAIRIMGFHRDAPGFTDELGREEEDVNQAEQYGIRGILAWDVTGHWKLSLMGAMQHMKLEDVAFTDNFEGRLERSNTVRPSPTESSYELASLNLTGSYEWGDLISQSSFVEKEFDAFLDESRVGNSGGRVPLLAIGAHNNSKAFSQELRLVSAPGDSPWKWLLGAFYYDIDLRDCAEIGAAASLPGLPPLPILNPLLATPCAENAEKLRGTLDVGQLLGEINVQEAALFGELTRELGDAWEVTLGARGYRTQSGGTVSNTGVLYTAAQNQGRSGVREASVEEDGISPKASIVFLPTNDVRTYLTVSRGFRFGGAQLGASTLTTTVPETYKSDTLWNYELGLRTDWLERTLRFDASVYRIDWQDPQVSQTSSDSLATYIDNVGGVEGTGVDASLRYLPSFLQGLSLDISAAWNRTQTTEDFRSATSTPTNEVIIPAGSPWPLSPEWQTSTTLAYALPLDTWMLGASLRHAYLGKACNTIECTAQVFGFRTLDANLSLAPIAGGWWPELSVSLANLTDERGFANISNNATLGDTAAYIAPRTLIVRIGGRF